ncbi:MAG TPA: helix-turn-helix domain-containing protein [Thermoanaerobaculia bacterium]|nr:helix-turn-helix domain-containing protein [Thermoanaerobaculia bacterium]
MALPSGQTTSANGRVVRSVSAAHHVEAVAAVVHGEFSQSESSSIEVEAVSSSWRRSAQAHHVNPESRESPRILTESSLRSSIEPIENVVLAAQTELDRLHRMAGQAGYVTLLCDQNGIAIDYRGNDQRSDEFRHWGVWRGGVWSEDIEGTNGIGTCIAECRPITVHQSQHYRARHIGLSCSGAPIFDSDARLVAVLDVSSIDPDLSAQAHALTLPLVTTSARMIEERLFRERFRKEWIIAVAPHDEQPASLLAVDRDHRVVGADRNARAQYRIDSQSMDAGVSVWAIFSRKGLVLRKGVPTDCPARLTTVSGGDNFFALVSSPVTTSRLHIGKLEATLLMQPRIDLLEDLSRRFTIKPPRGGLAPGALRRVTEYMDSHLCEELALESLAAHAGLSTSHFARAFKQSVGVPPHRYLLEQRVKKAGDLLKQTQEPLTAIAQSLGFADQSHFSRSFHWLVGLAPSEFRRSHR